MSAVSNLGIVLIGDRDNSSKFSIPLAVLLPLTFLFLNESRASRADAEHRKRFQVALWHFPTAAMI